ncbi:hypothetical protein M419DRAFT_12353 [Trichoderma reesei RUT C-30]|uniref:Uncharacterized protein n=1 Tax=Hypocrea jecorina (strain ATCC 56765 / BCRC 32924 / NRRL 11460 / Rut C-30) TaxID=1344414 RepID=A0A024RY39_HYPJR|nr:hypothetical protein M419DRAFT_12353 [Trichoderma reesei RUT C-30]
MNSDPSTTILVTDPRTLRMLQDRSQEPAQAHIGWLIKQLVLVKSAQASSPKRRGSPP